MKKLLFLLVLCTFGGCQNKIYDNLLETIKFEFNSRNDTITISLVDFTKFEWDNVFIFSGSYSNEEISFITGANYKGEILVSDGIQMIFLYKQRIVYTEIKTNHNDLQFNKLTKPDRVPHYTPDNSKFKVIKMETYEGSKRFFYNLLPTS